MKDRRVCEKLSDAVGWTPLLRLRRSVEDLAGEFYAKLEFMNPMGSAKDRIARHMVEKAMREGRLQAGDIVVENSSGNTAMGLAMMAAQEGLRCKMVVRDRTSREKIDCLRAVGVDLCLVDADLPPEDPESYNKKAISLAEELPGAWFPDQHNNRDNNEAHYLTTGPEIWEQMEGRVDFLVAGMGTGGTISGVGRYLKERDPNVTIIAIDPVGSVFHQYFHEGTVGEPGPYLLEGLGDEEIIGCPEFEFIDHCLRVTDGQAFLAARQLARSEGVLAGGSSGAALWGLTEAVRRFGDTVAGRPARYVTIFSDSGSRYLSTIYNDDWMRRQGYLD